MKTKAFYRKYLVSCLFLFFIFPSKNLLAQQYNNPQLFEIDSLLYGAHEYFAILFRPPCIPWTDNRNDDEKQKDQQMRIKNRIPEIFDLLTKIKKQIYSGPPKLIHNSKDAILSVVNLLRILRMLEYEDKFYNRIPKYEGSKIKSEFEAKFKQHLLESINQFEEFLRSNNVIK